MSEKKNPAWCRALKGCLLLGWLLGSGRENLILFKPKLVFLWCWARHLAPLSTGHKWMQDTSHSVVRWLPLVVQRASAPGCCACPIPWHKKKAQGQGGWALWKPLPPRVLLRDCWGSEDSPVCELKPGSWENCCGTTSSFFLLCLGITVAQPELKTFRGKTILSLCSLSNTGYISCFC